MNSGWQSVSVAPIATETCATSDRLDLSADSSSASYGLEAEFRTYLDFIEDSVTSATCFSDHYSDTHVPKLTALLAAQRSFSVCVAAEASAAVLSRASEVCLPTISSDLQPSTLTVFRELGSRVNRY